MEKAVVKSIVKQGTLITLILCLILTALPVMAMAGTVNLPRTGQTTSYATNDDGAIQAGVAWPSPRFTDNGDQTMTDKLTGLIWAKDAGTPSYSSCTGGGMPWENALVYVACLNTANYLGHKDWRLPNINELESLINVEKRYGDWLETQGFKNVAYDSHYLSSTTYAGDTGYVWYLYLFYGGDVYTSGKSSGGVVWPVRTGGASAPAVIWKTGQTHSYHFGDDGATQAGAAWPSPRFIDNGDDTVTDKLTDLMWTKNANMAGDITWLQALNYVATMDYSSSGTYGHIDWRMPNRTELRSLADYSQYGVALAENPFTNVQSASSAYYWSSSTDIGDSSGAWVVDMIYGNVFGDSKSYTNYLWPVRSVTYTLDVSKSGTGTGTITSKPAGISCGSTCSASYDSGTGLYLIATADSGSTFSGYTGCDTSNSNGCYVLMSSAKSVTATFASSAYNTASTMINAIYSQYPSVFGTKSGDVTTGTDTGGTYYVQWFTNGTAILAYSDGHMYYNYGGKWYSLGVVWNNPTAASTMINTIYSGYASFFGTKSGGIVTGTSGSATYYVQWFTNAAAIVAWTDGYMYTYYNGTWFALGVKWS
ncbi:MAG: DUF1566 domain-containing protein [Nitrospirae bacterium]|nr:DUF1566 domain-containing protein [Nitrospirota bacterium]